jgi:hypothetical protein
MPTAGTGLTGGWARAATANRNTPDSLLILDLIILLLLMEGGGNGLGQLIPPQPYTMFGAWPIEYLMHTDETSLSVRKK